MEDMEDDIDLSSTKIDKDEVHDNEVLRFVKSKGHRAIYSAMKVLLINVMGPYICFNTIFIIVTQYFVKQLWSLFKTYNSFVCY